MVGVFACSLPPIATATYSELPRRLPQAYALQGALEAPRWCWRCAPHPSLGSYVSGRLTEPSTYYERNQRGFVVEKDREAQTRDRLLNEYEVRPVLRRVDRSMVALSVVILAAAMSLQLLTSGGDSSEVQTPGYLSQLREDDSLAAREQRRAQQSGKPTFCESKSSYAQWADTLGRCD